jgi:hypothetical protein
MAEETLRPGWSRSVEGLWLVVVNTNEYPQEVKTVTCRYIHQLAHLAKNLLGRVKRMEVTTLLSFPSDPLAAIAP